MAAIVAPRKTSSETRRPWATEGDVEATVEGMAARDYQKKVTLTPFWHLFKQESHLFSAPDVVAAGSE